MLKTVSFLCLVIFISCNSTHKSAPVAQVKESVPKYDVIEHLPEAKHYDITLELDLIKTANQFQHTYTVTEVIITSDRWSSIFNESGQIIGRYRSATIIVTKGQTCLLQDVIFEQKRKDNTFKETRITENSEWFSFYCKLLETKNPDLMARVLD